MLSDLQSHKYLLLKREKNWNNYLQKSQVKTIVLCQTKMYFSTWHTIWVALEWQAALLVGAGKEKQKRQLWQIQHHSQHPLSRLWFIQVIGVCPSEHVHQHQGQPLSAPDGKPRSASCRHTQSSCCWAKSGHQKTSQISPAVTACCHTLRPHFLRPDPVFLTGWLRRMCVHWREKREERKKIPMTLHFSGGKWTFSIVRGWRRGLQTVLALFWNSASCLHNKNQLDSLALEPDFSVFRLNTEEKCLRQDTLKLFSLVSARLFSSGQHLMALCSLSSATYLSAPPPQASETDLCAAEGHSGSALL